jgi:hypothetical protein
LASSPDRFDTNPRISAALERLLSASAQWSATKVAEGYEAEQQVLECIERYYGASLSVAAMACEQKRQRARHRRGPLFRTLIAYQ